MSDTQTFPIIDGNGADPWVLYEHVKGNGVYYYTRTTGRNVVLRRSPSLSGIAAGEQRVLYENPEELVHLWAPEIHRLDGGWYVYFAACRPGDEIHHMYVLVNREADPFTGDWECMPLRGMDDKFAIDGTVFEAGGEAYFLWSGWEGYVNVQQNIYIARMYSPVEIKPEKILLTAPEYDWERHGEPLVNEGPQVLIRSSTVNLVYSASGSWTDDYCLGLLHAPLGADYTNPDSWEKEKLPIFGSANQIWGPGHCSFAESPDAAETWMIYHAAKWKGAGWCRSVHYGKVEFDEQGKIMRGEPAACDRPICIPSGDAERKTICGEKAFALRGNMVFADEVEGSPTGSAARGFAAKGDGLSLTFTSATAGDKLIYIYVRLESCQDKRYIRELEVEVNHSISVEKVYPCAYFQPLVLRAAVERGKNTLCIRALTDGNEISLACIQVEI